MQLFVLSLGTLITAMSIYLFVRPVAAQDLVGKVFASNWVYGAAMARILMGAGLIGAASAVSFPQIISALGWLIVLAGLFLLVVPPRQLRKLARWFQGFSTSVMRLLLCPGIALGGFLLYAALR